MLLLWTSLPLKVGIRVHILNECLLKGNFTSLGAADAEQEHRDGSTKGGQTSPTASWKEGRKSRKLRCGNAGIFQSIKKSKLDP